MEALTGLMLLAVVGIAFLEVQLIGIRGQLHETHEILRLTYELLENALTLRDGTFADHVTDRLRDIEKAIDRAS